MLETVGWLGVLFLLMETGLEVDFSSAWRQRGDALQDRPVGHRRPDAHRLPGLRRSCRRAYLADPEQTGDLRAVHGDRDDDQRDARGGAGPARSEHLQDGHGLPHHVRAVGQRHHRVAPVHDGAGLLHPGRSGTDQDPRHLRRDHRVHGLLSDGRTMVRQRGDLADPSPGDARAGDLADVHLAAGSPLRRDHPADRHSRAVRVLHRRRHGRPGPGPLGADPPGHLADGLRAVRPDLLRGHRPENRLPDPFRLVPGGLHPRHRRRRSIPGRLARRRP